MAPVPPEILAKWAMESGTPLDKFYPTHYSTTEWLGAGRPPARKGYGTRWYSSRRVGDDYGYDYSFADWLRDRYTYDYYRRQLDHAPGADGFIHPNEVPHYVVQRGMPRAFTYAIGLGTGIKVGKSGTGDGDLLTQLDGRFSQYRSTHKIEVIGIESHYLRDIDAAETDLLKALAEYKLDFGEELFQDCPETRDILWKWFASEWHKPKLLASVDERRNYFWDVSNESAFCGLKGKTHTFPFDWRDYVRLIEEIELCNLVLACPEEAEQIAEEYRENEGLPSFGESEDDDLLLEILNIYLPKDEARYPTARKKLHAYMGWPL